jgi:hypothetical protein
MKGMSNLWRSIGGIGSNLYAMGNNPANAAMGYAEELPGLVTPYYQPYIDTGLRSLSTLEKQFNQLISDPYAVYAMLGENFEESPGYQWQYDNAMNASNNANAAGGMLGTPSHQQQSAELATGLASQDWWNFMNAMTGLFGTGLGGLTDLNQMGYTASDTLAGLLAQNLMNKGMIDAMAASNKNSSMGSIIGGTVDAVSGIF